jgi:hypothetical protein
MDWFRGWLDDVAPAGRPVVLVGFSGEPKTALSPTLPRPVQRLPDREGLPSHPDAFHEPP